MGGGMSTGPFHTSVPRHMRLSSLTACGPGAAAELASKVRSLQADAVFWLTESSQPAELAVALADSAESVVGAVTTQGLIGGGGEHSRSLGSASMPGVPYSFSPSPEAERTVALAISGLSGGASLLPWHSPPDGLPDLPEAFWTDHAVAPPEMSPHLLLLAAPPSSSSFGVERWPGLDIPATCRPDPTPHLGPISASPRLNSARDLRLGRI